MKGLILGGGNGTYEEIDRLQIKPVAHRLMPGDNSEVWIRW